MPRSAALAACLAALVLPADAGSQGEPTLCFGRPADFVGDPVFADTYTGGAGSDVIAGLGGNDVLDGRGGNDFICGGTEDDHIKGGEGDDKIAGEAGEQADTSKQVLKGEGGADTIEGGDDDDDIYGGGQADDLYGHDDTDFIDGGGGRDLLEGGEDAARDVLWGQGGEDKRKGGRNAGLYGGDGGDYLDGGEGDDYLDGGPGDDSGGGTPGVPGSALYGNEGEDKIEGGGGDDELIGDTSNDPAYRDELSGGDGDDELHGGGARDALAGDDDNDRIYGEEGNDSFLVGGEGNDHIYGGDGEDGANGQAGNDHLFGQKNADYLNGEGDTDDCDGGGGRDVCDGGLPGHPTRNAPDDPDTCKAETKLSCKAPCPATSPKRGTDAPEFPCRWVGTVSGTYTEASGCGGCVTWQANVTFNHDPDVPGAYSPEGSVTYTDDYTLGECTVYGTGTYGISPDEGHLSVVPQSEHWDYWIAGELNENESATYNTHVTCPDYSYDAPTYPYAIWILSEMFEQAPLDAQTLSGTHTEGSVTYSWNLSARFCKRGTC